MGWYHAFLSDEVPQIVYHLCPKSHWQDKAGTTYYPPSFTADGSFIHSTADPTKLMSTANCFYKESEEEEWICLKVDTVALRINGIETKLEKAKEGSSSSSTERGLCPHICGGIPRETVVAVFPVQRNVDGSFLFVKGLTDVCPSSSHGKPSVGVQ